MSHTGVPLLKIALAALGLQASVTCMLPGILKCTKCGSRDVQRRVGWRCCRPRCKSPDGPFSAKATALARHWSSRSRPVGIADLHRKRRRQTPARHGAFSDVRRVQRGSEANRRWPCDWKHAGAAADMETTAVCRLEGGGGGGTWTEARTGRCSLGHADPDSCMGGSVWSIPSELLRLHATLYLGLLRARLF